MEKKKKKDQPFYILLCREGGAGEKEIFPCIYLRNTRRTFELQKGPKGMPIQARERPTLLEFQDVAMCYEILWSLYNTEPFLVFSLRDGAWGLEDRDGEAAG